MSHVLFYDDYEILAAGANKNYDISIPVDVYRIKTTGTVALVGNMTFGITGSPVYGTELNFLYSGSVTLGAFNITFLGATLTAAQALYQLQITAFYNGSAWEVFISPDNQNGNTDINGGDIVDASITGSKIALATIALEQLAVSPARGYGFRAGFGGVPETFNAVTSGQILQGNGTDLVSNAVSGDITINGSGVTAIGANKVLTAMINTAQVTVAKLEASLNLLPVNLNVSFEAGEQCNNRFKMPFSGTITGIYGVVTKAVANTDSGTVILKNAAGTTTTNGTLTFAASDPLETAYSASPSANNTFSANDILYCVTSKVTAGGRIAITLTVQRT